MSFSDKRENAISVAKGALSSVFKGNLVEHYLNIQSDFRDLSVLDVLYLAKTSPNERIYKSYEDWNNNENLKIVYDEEGTVFPQFGTGVYFTRNQTEPKKGNHPDENKESKEKSSSETKKLSVYKPKINLTLREKMRALLANNQTRLGMTENLERTHGKAAYFDAELNAVIINKNSTPEEIYRQLAEELSHAEFAHSDRNYTREKYEPLAQMSAYVVCRQNAVQTEAITFPDDYKSLSDDEVSEKLEAVKSCTDSMTDNIDYYYDNGKDRQERYTPRIRIELDETKREPNINLKTRRRPKQPQLRLKYNLKKNPGNLRPKLKSRRRKQIFRLKIKDKTQKEATTAMGKYLSSVKLQEKI